MPKPGSRAWRKRAKKLLAQEMTMPLRWFYCSFADDSRGGFLGGVFIQAHGVGDCSVRTHILGINPGGELVVFEVSDDKLPAEKYRNVLLSKEMLREAFGEIVKLDGSKA